MSESNLNDQIIDLIVREIPTDTVNAYGIWKVLNRIVIANDRPEIRPQMMYNYARNGMIVKGEKIFGQTLREFTRQEVAEFIIRYASRNELEIRFVKDQDQLELDLGI